MKTKYCIKCKKRLPANKKYFWRDKKFKDGLSCRCRECAKKQSKPRVHKKCPGCETEFLTNRNKEFCSRKCWMHNYHITKLCSSYLCKTCGNVFYSNRWRQGNIRRRVFCCTGCRDLYYSKIASVQLSNLYIIRNLTTHCPGVNTAIVKQYPEIIELKRVIINLKRLNNVQIKL